MNFQQRNSRMQTINAAQKIVAIAIIIGIIIPTFEGAG